jgi:hypothetical protein
MEFEKFTAHINIPSSKNPKDILATRVNQAKSLASAMMSRGFSNNKVEVGVKKLRAVSCFGNEDVGGNIPKCSHLMNSSTEGKFFCGACGCGDKPGTWLLSNGEKYSKLDYPKLSCPLNMPGFTNYIPLSVEGNVNHDPRKGLIEKLTPEDLEKIHVSIPEIMPKDQADQKS